MQRPGSEAIRTQIQPSNPKRDITNITNSQTTKRTHGQPSEQFFQKGGHSETKRLFYFIMTHPRPSKRQFRLYMHLSAVFSSRVGAGAAGIQGQFEGKKNSIPWN